MKPSNAEKRSNHEDDAARHLLICDEHSNRLPPTGEGNAMGYPTDERHDTEMVCGGVAVVRQENKVVR